MRVGGEVGRIQRRAHFSLGAPIAGVSAMPASTSAKWRTSIALPLRASRPAIFIRQAEIASKQNRRAALFDGVGLLLDDGGGDIAIFHRECAAEAAAARMVLHLDEIESAHGAEQFARLRGDAELAQAGAGVVIGHAMRKFGVDGVDLQDRDKKV